MAFSCPSSLKSFSLRENHEVSNDRLFFFGTLFLLEAVWSCHEERFISENSWDVSHNHTDIQVLNMTYAVEETLILILLGHWNQCPILFQG